MLRSRLDRIARSLDEEIDPAMRHVAERVAQGAQARVPVDSGALRNAIHVERQDEGAYRVVAGDGDVFYGHIVEHGSVRVPPRPFLLPAAESVRDNIDELVRAALKDL
jgi:HK97 gp10 family phage protein